MCVIDMWDPLVSGQNICSFLIVMLKYVKFHDFTPCNIIAHKIVSSPDLLRFFFFFAHFESREIMKKEKKKQMDIMYFFHCILALFFYLITKGTMLSPFI